jgi:galactose mutarotase-like enzyme
MTVTDFPMQQEIVLRHGDTMVGVMPDICLVSHFQVGSWPVLYRANTTGNIKRWGMPLMIPNFSRLKDGVFAEKHTTLPTHGFGRNMPWTVLEHTSDSLTIQLTSNEHTRSQYPYEFAFTSQILVREGTLTYILTMENRSDETMPIAPGFHPYFTVAQAQKAQLSVKGLADFNPQLEQWATQPPDRPYLYLHNVSIDFPGQGTLTIEEEPIEGSYSLAMMQVWSEPSIAPDHDFVCFEPVVASEDGLNRPEDRLNIPPHSSHKLILKLTAKPF